MSDEKKVVELARHRKITYTDDPIGTLQQAIECARTQAIDSVIVTMVDEEGEEYYLLSDETADPAMLGALEIAKSIVVDELRDMEE